MNCSTKSYRWIFVFEIFRMFLTRCPRVIPVLWTIINTFVEERTRDKFAILKTDELTEYIDEINIPDFLGGQMPVSYSDDQ